MRKSFYSILAILAIAGCTKEIENPENVNVEQNGITIIASVADDTKATLEVDGTVAHNIWSQNDEIAVLGNTVCTFNHPAATGKVFNAALKDGESISGDLVAAAYPRAFASKGTTEGFKITIPGTIENYVPGQTNAIMVAGAPAVDGSNYTFTFRQVAALLGFTINNVPVGTKVFSFTAAGMQIFGEWDNVTSTSEIEAEAGDNHNNICIELKDAVTTANQTLKFFVPIPTGTYGDIQIDLYDEDLNLLANTTANLSGLGEIEKGKVAIFPEITLPEALTNGEYAMVAKYTDTSNNVHYYLVSADNRGTSSAAAKNQRALDELTGFDGTLSAVDNKYIWIVNVAEAGVSFKNVYTDQYLVQTAGEYYSALGDNEAFFTWIGRHQAHTFAWIDGSDEKRLVVNYNNGNPIFGTYKTSTITNSTYSSGYSDKILLVPVTRAAASVSATTLDATNLSSTSGETATLNGTISTTNVAAADNVTCGFEYWLTSTPAEKTVVPANPSNGAISCAVEGLTPEAQYSYRAWAKLNDDDKVYGEVKTFATEIKTQPTTKTYTHAITTKPNTTNGGENQLSGVTWIASNANNLGNYNSGNYAGVQLGTSSKNGALTLTTKEAWGTEEGSGDIYGHTTVKKVYVWLNNGSGTISATVKINGVDAIPNGTVAKNSSAGNDYTKTSRIEYTPAANGTSGLIEITATSTKAGYICAIEVECE